MRVLQGVVATGRGDFAQWIRLLHDHYFRKTGLRLFPGTLNVQLQEPYRLPPNVIRLEKEEYGGRVSVSMVPCRIFGHKAFLLRTDQNEAETGDHAHTIIEIATDVPLRATYGLADGAVVDVELLD